MNSYYSIVRITQNVAVNLFTAVNEVKDISSINFLNEAAIHCVNCSFHQSHVQFNEPALAQHALKSYGHYLRHHIC